MNEQHHDHPVGVPDSPNAAPPAPLSGRYEGEMTSPNAGNLALDLRFDIDSRHTNSPVMNVVSGDFYRLQRFDWFGRTYKWRIYNESWIVDNPCVTWSRSSVRITGAVRYWKCHPRSTSIVITIPWTGGAVGPATVTVFVYRVAA